MGNVGFGAYRISKRSIEHRMALHNALELGCKIIDTSANYTNGESEELIGAILFENKKYNPEIVTKGGYIQGVNIELINRLNSEGKCKDDLVIINDDLMHSIHPDFLATQIDLSLGRLQKSKLDTYLLHNPEYYFKSPESNSEEYYSRIRKAFEFLEDQVQAGRIARYGISSNTFVQSPLQSDTTLLEEVYKQALAASSNHHFQVIQFPFNLIEIGALEKFGEYGDKNLLETAHDFKLRTLINRPLNAFSNNQLVRLATYESFALNFNQDEAQEVFNKCMLILENKWKEFSLLDDQAQDENFYSVSIIKQFTEIWKSLPTPDSVEQIYYGYMFPFIARMWGEGGLSAQESKPFYQLFEFSLIFSRINMTKKALEFQVQASNVGLVPISNQQAFAIDVIETYLNYGFDTVLVGMKKPEYVNQLKHLF